MSVRTPAYTAIFTRWLLAFGVVCVLGLQAQESVHHHDFSEPDAQCLLCHSPAKQALISATLPIIAPIAEFFAPLHAHTTAISSAFDLYLVRGPPPYS